MSESHSGNGNEHGGGDVPHSRRLKNLVFVGFMLVLAIVAFVAWNNGKFISENIIWIAIAAVVVYLIIRYDYILQLTDYKRAVVFTLGKVNRVGGPGWTIIFPPFEFAEIVDLRTQAVDIPKQEVVTKDGIEVTIDAVIYLSINEDNASVINSVTKINDYIEASKQYVIGILRDRAGSFTMAELVSNVDKLNLAMKQQLERIAREWGVNVEEALIKDINIPKTVLEAMHEEKAAVQRKLARIQAAEAQRAEIDAVRGAAEQLNDKALAYYYIRALEKLGEGKSTKFVLPLELTELAQSLSGRNLGGRRLEELMQEYAPVVKKIAEKNRK